MHTHDRSSLLACMVATRLGGRTHNLFNKGAGDGSADANSASAEPSSSPSTARRSGASGDRRASRRCAHIPIGGLPLAARSSRLAGTSICRDPVCLPRSGSAAGGGERGDAGSRTPGAGLRCASPPARSRSLSALVPPDHASGHRATAECARGRGVAQTRTCLVYPCRASCSINRIRCPARQYPRPHSRRTFASAACAHGLLRLRFSGGSADRGAREPVRLQNPRLPFPRRPSKGCASAPPVLPRPAPGRTLDRGSCGSRSLTH